MNKFVGILLGLALALMGGAVYVGVKADEQVAAIVQSNKVVATAQARRSNKHTAAIETLLRQIEAQNAELLKAVNP
jgi:hypothetical protein